MAKRKHVEEHENHERWLVSYADFITLLFAFFTVLYATSQHDVTKMKDFEESVRNAFNASFLDFGGTLGETINEKGNTLIPPPINMFPTKQIEPTEVQEAVERLIESSLSKEERLATITDVRHDSVGVHISMAAETLFAPGSDSLLYEAKKALDKISHILRISNRRLIIEGHTDNQPISTSRFPSNWELSAARATRIVRYLIKHQRIDPKRLVAVAYADQKPITSNSTKEGRIKNRRIDVLIVTSDSEL